MIAKKIDLTVFSKDKDFTRLVFNNEFIGDGLKKREISHHVRIDTKNVESVRSADVIIYDLGLVNGDLRKVTKDLLVLRLRAKSKPLVLIGDRSSIGLALNSKQVKPLIARAVCKPVVSSQLRMVVEAAVPKQVTSRYGARKAGGVARFLSLFPFFYFKEC